MEKQKKDHGERKMQRQGQEQIMKREKPETRKKTAEGVRTADTVLTGYEEGQGSADARTF